MNNENFLFPICHPHTNGKYGGCLTFLRYFSCLSLSTENVYSIYIENDIIHSYKSDRIVLFLKNTNSYTIHTSEYRSCLHSGIPDLNVVIYDSQVVITYFLGYSSYVFSLTGQKKQTFLRNIENCYKKFHELNN
jgi:hypothetical protein